MSPANLPAWLELTPLVGAMVLVWIGTPYFWLRQVRLPVALSVAVAPAVTTSLLWLMSLAWYQAGWTWSGATVLPVVGVLGIVGGLLYLPSRARSRRFAPGHLGLAAAVVLGWGLAALPMMFAGKPNDPVQQWDPTFHMNGVWGITQYGIAAPGPGLSHNFGGSQSKEYPIAWHAFTSLFATGPTTVSASNASALALMAVWVISSAALVYFLYGLSLATAAAAVVAGVLPSMPADALGAYSQAPNAMSVALMPGIAGVAILVGRELSTMLKRKAGPGAWRRWLVSVAILAGAAWGGLQAHPVIAFNLTVFLAPAALAGLAGLSSWALRNRRTLIVWGAVATVVGAIAVIAAVMLTPEVTSMRAYKRSGVDIPTALSQVLVPTPPFPTSIGVPLTVGTTVALAIAGSLWLLLARRGRPAWASWPTGQVPVAWPIWSYTFFLVLVFFAYGPNWEIRKWFVGPWFSDGRRIMEPMSLALVILAALGFQWIADRLRTVLGKSAPALLGTALLLLTGLGGLSGRTAAFASVMDPEQLGKSGMATRGALDLMSSLPDLIPEDSVVLGDPKAGAAYSQMIGQRVAYFPQLTLVNANRDAQDFLLSHFDEIAWNPEVCEVLAEEGITHFFQYPDGYYYGRLRSERAPGLYQVDTEVGFELVGTGDDARLYEITACN